jgi:4-hydroxy-2-oxoheptanedioate aldolase
MLHTNRMKQRLREGQEVTGLFCSIPAPITVEMIGLAGYDFVIIDTEHVLVNPETLEHMLRAAEAVGITALVRVADTNAGTILRALDGGAYGIVAPHIAEPAQLAALVRASRYHPEGQRSLNGGRPGAFGKFSLVDYMHTANQEIMVVPMIESRQGVESIDAILDHPGIDMIMVGTADLSQSYGVPWQTGHTVVTQAVETVFAAARARDIPFCAILRKADEIAEWRRKGVQAYILGDERGVSFRALQDHLRRFST